MERMHFSEIMDYFLEYERAGDRLYTWDELCAMHQAENDLCRQWDDQQEWMEYA
jgi:hypothetical protein